MLRLKDVSYACDGGDGGGLLGFTWRGTFAWCYPNERRHRPFFCTDWVPAGQRRRIARTFYDKVVLEQEDASEYDPNLRVRRERDAPFWKLISLSLVAPALANPRGGAVHIDMGHLDSVARAFVEQLRASLAEAALAQARRQGVTFGGVSVLLLWWLACAIQKRTVRRRFRKLIEPRPIPAS